MANRAIACLLFLLAPQAAIASPAASRGISPIPMPQSQSPAPAEVCTAFGISSGFVRTLGVPAAGTADWSFEVELGGIPVVIDLSSFDVCAPGCQHIEYDEATSTVIAPEPCPTYRGSVRGYLDSSVAAAILMDGVQAFIQFQGSTWCVEPQRLQIPTAGASDHVLYAAGDALAVPGVFCDPNQVEPGDPEGGCPSIAPLTRECDVALDLDRQFVNRFGAAPSSFRASRAAALNLINAASMIYTSSVSISYRVTATRLPIVASEFFPLNNPGNPSAADLGAWVNSYVVAWGSSPLLMQIPRNLVHIISGKGAAQGAIGYAYYNGICNPSLGFGATRAVLRPLARNVTTVAHEFGHNWGARHCTSPDCGIMCASAGGCVDLTPDTAFGQVERAQLCAGRQAFTACLRTAAAAAYSTFGAACTGASGLPRLSSQGRPLLGGVFSLLLSNAAPNAAGALYVGVSNTSYAGIPLPFDLSVVGAPGCQMLVSQELIVPTLLDGQGAAQLDFAVPNDPAMLGVPVYNQAAIADASANAFGYSFTNAGRGLPGNR